MLGPFCKDRLELQLSGTTNGHDKDFAVDILKASGLQTLRKFILIDDHLKLDIIRRGMGDGKGLVFFSCPNLKKIKTIQENFIGKVNKIRGLAFSCRVPPQLATRVGKVVRSSFSEYIKDNFIYNETNKCDKQSKGFGLALVGETCNGQGEQIATFTVEASVRPGDDTSPEELGEQIVKKFSTEMGFLGVVDSYSQPLLCALIRKFGIFRR